MRWAVAVIVVLHGVVHMIGAGAGWWLAALLVVGAGVLTGFQVQGWWMVAAVAAITSQAMILTAWPDAWAGTAGNVVLLLAAVYGLASQGPGSLRRRYRDLVAAVLSAPVPADVVTESALDGLPAPVAGYLRRSGAVAGPRITSFHARIHGRIRQGPDKPWMPFTAEQVNAYGPRTSRLFLMDATMFGLPVDVLHTFVGSDATMRAKVCSIVPVADAAGPDMARAETVTLLNDLCVFAPAALVDAPITWETLDDRRVRATYVTAAHTVTAELVFNDQAELVDFISEDRLAASPDGSTFTPQRWSTPLRDHRQVGPYRLAAAGEGRWHPDRKPPFTYIELHLDQVTYNLGTPVGSPAAHRRGAVDWWGSPGRRRHDRMTG